MDGVNYLKCNEGGFTWLYTSLWGSFFVTFHIMIVLMQSVMMEKVFYGVPHHAGFFDEDEATPVAINDDKKEEA